MKCGDRRDTAWGEQGFRRIGAALGRLQPEQHAFVFAGVGRRTAGEREAALLELGAWSRGCSETARAVIRRRDHLVMLGLSQRKVSKASEGSGDSDDTELSRQVAP